MPLRLLTLSSGRRSKFVVGAAALLLVAVLGLFSGRLDGALNQDPLAGLPSGVDSVAVARAAPGFESGRTTTAVTVVRRDGGLTRADRSWLEARRRDLDARRLPAAAATPPARRSADGTSALLVTALRTGDDATVTAATAALRERLGTGRPAGLEVAVTGPAGVTADLSAVFDGADSRLLALTGLLVVVLLIVNYRSPVFWLIPFATVALAELANRGAGYGLTRLGLEVDAAGSGIASVLVFGAATDYALLLVARYREELRRHEDPHEAMRVALSSAGPAIVASGLTVAAALLTLLLCRVGGSQSIGPLSATGVLLAMALSLTLLPCTLLLAGRRAFWPLIPRAGGAPADPGRSAWGRLGRRVARRPRPVWIGGAVVLAIAAAGTATLPSTLSQSDQFLSSPEAIEGETLLARSFPAGTSSPAQVLVRDTSRTAAVTAALRAQRTLVASVGPPERGIPGDRLDVVLRGDPLADEALDAVPRLRTVVRRAGGADAVVGGETAEQHDLRSAARRDTLVVVPVALLVVALILIGLLRALLLPVVLIASVVLSFGAALGIGAVVFEHVLGFVGADPTLPLLAFVFLTALGVDYTIFLTARVREGVAAHGTREATTRALAATGAVITSAGVVLAGTFSILGVLPLVVLAELGFVIALGVLIDTLLVRSVVVPAVVYDLGGAVWWPSRLDRAVDAGADAPASRRSRPVRS